MLFAFIDESYTADRYYVAAIIVREENLAHVRNALADARAYARGFGIAADNVEYHAHSIMTGCDGWEPIKGQPRSAIAIYKDVLRRLAGLPVRMIIRGVDVQRLNARYRYPQPPHEVTLRHLLEQVDKFAEQVGDVVTVIADEVQGQAQHVARAMNYQESGTGGYQPRRLLQIQMPIVFGSSAQSPGVQTADLVVYLYRRLDAHVEIHEKTARQVAAMWSSLDPIRHHVWRWDP